MAPAKKKRVKQKWTTFGAWFAHKMESQAWTQTDVHRVLRDAGIEVSRASINRWINNRTVPNKNQMSQLLRAVNVTDKEERARVCAAYLGVDLT